MISPFRVGVGLPPLRRADSLEDLARGPGGRLIAGHHPVVDAQIALRTNPSVGRASAGTVQRAVGLSTEAAQKRSCDGIQVDAAVTVTMRAGKLEIRLR